MDFCVEYEFRVAEISVIGTFLPIAQNRNSILAGLRGKPKSPATLFLYCFTIVGSRVPSAAFSAKYANAGPIF
jgi:hypothetical protein